VGAAVFDLDNTLIFEDEATFDAIRRACDLARERAGVHAAALVRGDPASRGRAVACLPDLRLRRYDGDLVG
jgi:phosphoserine phosphatase